MELLAENEKGFLEQELAEVRYEIKKMREIA